MEFLTKNQILEAKDITFEDVEVPEWNGMIRIKCMTGSERDSYESALYEFHPSTDGKGKVKLNRDDLRAKLLARTIVNDKFERLFSDIEVKKLGEKSAEVLDRLFAIAQKLNGLGKEELDNAEKN